MLHIDTVPAARRRAALELLLSDWTPDERRQQLEEFARLPADDPAWNGLLSARRDDRDIAVVWGQLQPGRVAGVWPPRTSGGPTPDVALALLAAVGDRLRAQGVQLAQSLLAADQTADARLLIQAGFERLAALSYLLSTERDFPQEQPASSLEFAPYSAAIHAALAAVVEESYEGTLDCPRLNGLRSIDDVLAGYRAAGVFDPSRWLLVRYAGKPVGCLLLSDYPEHGHYELVYMGLRPHTRGRGWGIEIARHAQWLCRQAGRPRLVLGVDSSNGPALRMYGAVGFRAWEQRIALIRVLAAAKPSASGTHL